MGLFEAPDVDNFLDALLLPLPPGVNPYDVIDAAVNGIQRDMPLSVGVELSCLSAIFTVLLVLVLVSLVRKVRRNEFWIIRFLHSSRGSYLHPHLSIAWQLWTVVFLCGIQVNIWSVFYRFRGHDAPFLTTWGPFAYWPSWAGGWVAMWALAVSKASMVTEPPGGFLGALSSPTFLNAHFLLGPFLVFTVLAVCCGNIFHFYDRVPVEAAAAQAVIELLKRSYDAAAPKSQTLDVIRTEFGPALQRVFDTSNSVAGWFATTWTVWLCSAAYLYILMTVIAILHIRYIYENLLVPLRDGSQSTSSRNGLRRTLYGGSLAVFCVAGIGLSFTALAGWLAFASGDAAQSTRVIRIQTLLGLWLYAIFGLLATGVFLVQGIQPARSSNPTSSSFASASVSKASLSSQRSNMFRLAAVVGAKRTTTTPACEIALGHKFSVPSLYVSKPTKEDLDRDEERRWRQERECLS